MHQLISAPSYNTEYMHLLMGTATCQSRKVGHRQTAEAWVRVGVGVRDLISNHCRDHPSTAATKK